MANKLDQQLARLRREGYKITPARKRLLAVLLTAEEPLTASEIIDKLASNSAASSPDKVTIYRNLERLVEEKLVKHIQLKDNVVRYELSTQADHHHHLVCENCKRIIHVETEVLEPELAKAEAKLSGQHKFTIHSHALEFYGHCEDCERSAH